MQTHLRSCVGLGVGVWLITHPTTPIVRLSLAHFFMRLHTYLSLPQFMVAHLSWC